jgi:hypothetical protein
MRQFRDLAMGYGHEGDNSLAVHGKVLVSMNRTLIPSFLEDTGVHCYIVNG